jgi:lysophospholipase L1-like esterase
MFARSHIITGVNIEFARANADSFANIAVGATDVVFTQAAGSTAYCYVIGVKMALTNADQIPYDNTESKLVATEVQSAIDEHQRTIAKIAPDGNFVLDKAQFLITGKNLFDKDKAVQNYYVDNTNGNLSASSGFYASGFIKVEPSTAYVKNVSRTMAYYDEDRVYISGVTTGTTFTTPATCRYVRFSMHNNDSSSPVLDVVQLELGSTATPYEPYYNRFANEYENSTYGIINLPAKIFGVVGHELNVYFENILDDESLYRINVVCSKGTQYEKRWAITPTVAETLSLEIQVFDRKTAQRIASKTTSVIIQAVTVGDSLNRSCLFIGDSTTAGGQVTGELITLFSTDAMAITLVGTKGTSPNLHEGISGWTVANFIGATSPFYVGGVLDFSAYMTANSFTQLDRVLIHLGINDVFNYLYDYSVTGASSLYIGINTNFIANLNTLITNIKLFNADAKFGIALTIPPAYSQDAFGVSYTSGQTRRRHKRNIDLLVKALIAEYDGREAEGLYLIPVNTNLDTVNNMSTTTMNANARNTTQITVQNNGVHPANSGYYQIADSFYYWLKSLES